MFDTDVMVHPFRRDLILELHGHRTGGLEVPDGPLDVHRVAETHASIDDEGKTRSLGDPPRRVGDLGSRQLGVGEICLHGGPLVVLVGEEFAD